jgi:hypothetical protein
MNQGDSVELDAYAAEPHALSLAPELHVALGDLAPAPSLTATLDATVAAASAPTESSETDVESYTLTCGPDAELRLHWGELHEWLERS